MTGTKIQVRLYRDSFATPWGFRLQGGKDLNQPLVVQRVFCNSPAEGQLQRGDIIESIGIRRGADLSHKQAQDTLKHGGGQIELQITRPPSGREISQPQTKIIPVSTRAPQQNFDPIPEQKPQMPQPPAYGHQPKKVTVSKYGGGGPSFGAEYSGVQPSMQSRGGSYRPVEQYNMLNRVQGSLDNIIQSPRTPEASPSHAPFYQQYEQPYAPPPQQQPYMSTGERLERMNAFSEYPGENLPAHQPQPSARPASFHSTAERLEQLPPEDEENAIPVWERRQAFLGPSSYSHDPKPIKPKRSGPKFRKPTGPIIGTDYSKVGIDYAQRPGGSRPSSGVWQPPQQQQYNRPPDATSYTPSPYEDGEPTVPAWRNTLKSSGVKPWDEDIDYGTRKPAPEVHVAPRLVPYDSQPNPQQASTSNNVFNQELNPNVVHLQYNSPMGLYSNDKVQETIDGQTRLKAAQMSAKQPTMQPMKPVKVTQKAPGSVKAPMAPTGERDWSQSAVFRMVAQEDNPSRNAGQRGQGQRGPPPVLPKPSGQPPQFHPNQFQRPYDDEVGVSDF